MRKTSTSVTDAARNFADCVNRAHYQNVTFVLLKNARPSPAWCTHSLRNAWAFLGTLSVLVLCVLLGGVSGLMFAQGALAILAAAWLSLMVGLEQSCRNQGEHEAFSR